MNVNTKQLIELEPNTPVPEGFTPLPLALDPAAQALLIWAGKQRKKRKLQRKIARMARKRNRR